MIVLYENPLSSNSQKVRFLFSELAITYESRVIAMFNVGTRSPEFLAINPFGLLPVYVENGLSLQESNTILRFVADSRGSELYPRSPKLRANVDRWLDILGCTMRARMAPLERRRFANMPGGSRDLEEEAKLENNLRAVLDGVEAIFPDEGDYATGPFSIADCAWAPTLRRLADMGLDLSMYPKIRAWIELLLARPAWIAARGPDLILREI
jgi:glutathione S-transferase